MSPNPSEIFDFLSEPSSFVVERYEIRDQQFGALRGHLRIIAVALYESGDPVAIEMAGSLRTLVSCWLTVPVEFDQTTIEAIRGALGAPQLFGVRWGGDLKRRYEAALELATSLAGRENPMRSKLMELMAACLNNNDRIRIYCHRSARSSFESLQDDAFNQALDGTVFLHSERDYRECSLFDTLIKVGPLRTRGWGSIPDAVVTAPKFRKLLQVVWSGCPDESDFGKDPVASSQLRFTWNTTLIHVGDPAGPGPDMDDLQILGEMRISQEQRRAVLVHICANQGILFPPNAEVLTFDPDNNAEQPLARRSFGDDGVGDVFVILPELDNYDMLVVQAEHGYFSQRWKERLNDEVLDDEASLLHRLSDAGLDLVHLAPAVRNWCRPPSTVIHAPQQIQHFRVLMQVLGFDGRAPGQNAEWWQLAWNEVRCSRGEAIQAGVAGNELVIEQLLQTLANVVPQLREHAQSSECFILSIPDGTPLRGEVRFYKALAVEHGFSAPDMVMRTVMDTAEFQRWRA